MKNEDDEVAIHELLKDAVHISVSDKDISPDKPVKPGIVFESLTKVRWIHIKSYISPIKKKEIGKFRLFYSLNANFY